MENIGSTQDLGLKPSIPFSEPHTIKEPILVTRVEEPETSTKKTYLECMQDYQTKQIQMLDECMGELNGPLSYEKIKQTMEIPEGITKEEYNKVIEYIIQNTLSTNNIQRPSGIGAIEINDCLDKLQNYRSFGPSSNKQAKQWLRLKDYIVNWPFYALSVLISPVLLCLILGFIL